MDHYPLFFNALKERIWAEESQLPQDDAVRRELYALRCSVTQHETHVEAILKGRAERALQEGDEA